MLCLQLPLFASLQAPEVLMHGRCSRASDVYAYGILLWELATNSKPFAGAQGIGCLN
jgi:serine/threonine protein kinase